MNNRLLVPVFAVTLFLSAFLIFAVQPMVSKMLLPLLGGSPSVWNTAMVFFQAMLLAGYAYAHFVARYIPLKIQAVIHISLLALFTTVLPLAIPADAIPPEESGQAWWQLCTMLACIGGPFFVLAASAPLFQHWFASSGHTDAENPYYLYAISNIGSMVALLGYPTLIEPFLTLTEQSHYWMVGYTGLIAITAACTILVRNGVKPAQPLDTMEGRQSVAWISRFYWILLAFIPSSLMLGVTTLITTDLASAPFLWVIPLAIYLATFIIAFSKNPVISVPLMRLLVCYALCIILLMFMFSGFIVVKFVMIAMHLAAFFLCAQFCHGELALSKPSTSHLTEYFLLISFGGVLGGIFNALVSPIIFPIPLEYSLTLAIIPFVVWLGIPHVAPITGKFNTIEHPSIPRKLLAIDIVMIGIVAGICCIAFFVHNSMVQIWASLAVFCALVLFRRNKGVFAISTLIAFLFFVPGVWNQNQNILDLERNYFGIMKINEKNGAHFFYHGTTLHGAQFQKPEWKLSPITYYSPEGAIANGFKILDKHPGKQEIAVLGLGVGSVACYKKPGRHFDFYEIDSDVVKIAEDPKYFTYLKDCGSPYKIILGDARLKINEAPDKKYDMIFIDVFSSDNIPVHVTTRESFTVYLKKLKPGGFIVMNISNRFIDLRPVLTSIAKDLGMTVYFKRHEPEKDINDVSALYTASLVAVMSSNEQNVATFMEDYEWKPYSGKKIVKAWTDDYANIISSMYAFQ